MVLIVFSVFWLCVFLFVANLKTGISRCRLGWACAPLLTLMLTACAQKEPPPREREPEPVITHPDDPEIAAVIQLPEPHHVLISGHLYGMAVKTQRGIDEPLIYTENVLEAFAGELKRLRPAAHFCMGDLTRYTTEQEWEMMDRIFGGLPAPNFWVAGNHDLRNIPVFEQHGGLRNKVVIINRNKYICLDAKNIFEPHDLDFIERQVADHAEYDHVFVLMHFRLFNDTEPEPGADPYATYTGKSNWNSAVVPLLLGKVRYVFTGDHYAMHTMNNPRRYGEHELVYIHTSFQYRNEGPMLFLELRFGAGDFEMIPRAVPLDVRDPWYEDLRFKQ